MRLPLLGTQLLRPEPVYPPSATPEDTPMDVEEPVLRSHFHSLAARTLVDYRRKALLANAQQADLEQRLGVDTVTLADASANLKMLSACNPKPSDDPSLSISRRETGATVSQETEQPDLMMVASKDRSTYQGQYENRYKDFLDFQQQQWQRLQTRAGLSEELDFAINYCANDHVSGQKVIQKRQRLDAHQLQFLEGHY